MKNQHRNNLICIIKASENAVDFETKCRSLDEYPKYTISKHAKERLIERGIDEYEVALILKKGRIVKKYCDGTRKLFKLGTLVVVVDSDFNVITAYRQGARKLELKAA